MSEKTRYSKLLYHVLSENIRETFFSGEDDDTDAGWDLFEMTHPDLAEEAFNLLAPMLEDIKDQLDFQRLYNERLAAGDQTGAARLSILYKANKLRWD